MRKISPLNVISLVIVAASVVAFLILVVGSGMLPAQNTGQADTATANETPNANTDPSAEPQVAIAADGVITPTAELVAYARIAFVSERDGNLDIYTMNPDGSDVLRLTEHEAVDNYPVWSPDGTQIAFLSQRDGPPEVYVMNADGSDQVRLTDSMTEKHNVVWSPDGSRIGYIRQDGTNSFVVVPAVGGEETIMMEHANYVSWSPTDSGLAYTTEVEQDGLYQLTAQALMFGTSGPFSISDMWSDQPVWSPDGMRVAFIGMPDPTLYEGYLYVADLSGAAAVQQITQQPYSMQEISWSPDGQHIAFYAWNDVGAELYVINPSIGTEPIFLTTAVQPSKVAWSPDGQFIATEIGSNTGNSMIGVVAVDGSGSMMILGDESSYNGQPAWSPSGATSQMPSVGLAGGDATSTPPPTVPFIVMVSEEEFWPEPGTVIERDIPIDFAQYMIFSTSETVEVDYVGFLLYAGEDMPDSNYCYASGGEIPPPLSTNRMIWDDDFPETFEAGFDYEYEDGYWPEEFDPGSTHLVTWMVIRNLDQEVLWCRQQVYELSSEE